MKRSLGILLGAAAVYAVWFSLISAPCRAQQPRRRPAKQGSYKAIHKDAISAVVDGKTGPVADVMEKRLADWPDDLESLFLLAVARAQAGQPDAASESLQRAVEAGLPPERLVAGPRNLLAPLAETEAFRKLVAKCASPLVHGPMVGCVTDRSAKFWVRTAEEVSLQVVVSPSKDLAGAIPSPTVFTDADEDYTAVASVERLEPDTPYFYNVLVEGKPVLGEPASFRTYPPEGRPATFHVAFGGGAGYTPWHEQMWDTIGKDDPLAFLFLGDNVYIDTPTKPETQRYCYYRRQSRPEFRRLVAGASIYAIWDDHDFGTNDCWVTAERDEPPWKVPVWHVFRQNWNNPSYGGGEDTPGCWFRFRIADVDFFMLDGRYYRTNPRGEHPTMLGPQQKKWLQRELKHADGTFKVLASPVPWVLEAKGTSLDTWRGFQEEREELFRFLGENRVDGVVLISADRHRSDRWRIDRPDGYPLYEFESSRLTNVHTHGLMPGAIFGYNKECSFGKLVFDTTKPDPELSYQIVNIDGELIHTFTVKRSEISYR